MQKVSSAKAVELSSFVAVFLISYMQYRSWAIVHTDNYTYLQGAISELMEGVTHWRAYQNRLLAPLIYRALGTFCADPYRVFVQYAILFLNVGLFALVFIKSKSHFTAITAVAVTALFWVLEHHNSFYLWDLIEAGWLLALFAWATSTSQRPSWIWAIFIVALLNRETALFVGIFLVLSGSWRRHLGQAAGARRQLSGAVMMLATLIFVELARKLLFKSSIIIGVGNDEAHAVFENHFQLLSNLSVLKAQARAGSAFVFLILVHVLTLALMGVNGWKKKDWDRVCLSLTMMLYLAVIPVFGVVDELRLYQPLAWLMPLIWLLPRQSNID